MARKPRVPRVYQLALRKPAFPAIILSKIGLFGSVIPGVFQWYKWWKCPHTPITKMAIRIRPTHINMLIASHTRFINEFQPAKAVICADRKNMDVKAMPVKYTELCRKLVQNRVWYASSFRPVRIRHKAPNTIPPIRMSLVLLSNTNCVLVRFISQIQAEPDKFDVEIRFGIRAS